MRRTPRTERKRWYADDRRRFGPLVLLALFLQSCAGPQSLRVAIIAEDQTDYLSFINDANMNGREAFANWMSKEREVSPQEVLRLDAELSNTHNPFDAHHDRRAVSRGAVVYKIHCLRCHGEDAGGRGPATLKGHPANNFKSFSNRFAATVHRGAPRKWFRVIRDGTGEVVQYPDVRTTAMPSFKRKLANEQIWQVITYLQSLDMYAAQDEPERPR